VGGATSAPAVNAGTEEWDFTSTLAAGAWASGGTINSARSEFGGAAGTQTATLIFGGQADPLAQLNESYDGSSWTEVGDLNSDHYYAAGLGTQTAALCVTGNPSQQTNVESWNGTSWTEIADVNTGRWGPGSSKSGTSTAATIAAGKTTADVAVAETWDGTSWTEVGDLSTARRQVASCGESATSMLVISGMPAPKTVVESYDGSSWTEVGDVGASRYAGGGAGSVTSAIFSGGGPSSAANEEFDGSSWTEVANLPTAHDAGASAGTGVSAIVASGRNPGGSSHTGTAEWTKAQNIKVITD
jgi:hypothetical protein